MAIGVRSGLVIWQCMSLLCRGEYVTDQPVYAPDREPRKYGINESLEAMKNTSLAGKSLVRRPQGAPV
jgi:hypothetical protein